MSQKVIKWTKDTLIVLIEGYAILMYLSGFMFNVLFCFVSVVFFTSSKTSLRWSFRLLTGYLHVK